MLSDVDGFIIETFAYWHTWVWASSQEEISNEMNGKQKFGHVRVWEEDTETSKVWHQLSIVLAKAMMSTVLDQHSLLPVQSVTSTVWNLHTAWDQHGLVLVLFVTSTV